MARRSETQHLDSAEENKGVMECWSGYHDWSRFGGPRLSEPQRVEPRSAPVPSPVAQRYRTRCGSESRDPTTLSMVLLALAL